MNWESGQYYLKGFPLRCSPKNAHGELSTECPYFRCVWTYLSFFFLPVNSKILGHTSWDALYFSAHWIHKASESAFAFTLRFPAQERNRRILPRRVGACRGWEDTSPPLHPLPNGPGASEEKGQTCRVTVTPQCWGGGERTLRLCLCRFDKRTVESSPPRCPATASDDPTQRQRVHRHEELQGREKEMRGKETCRSNNRTCEEKEWESE